MDRNDVQRMADAVLREYGVPMRVSTISAVAAAKSIPAMSAKSSALRFRAVAPRESKAASRRRAKWSSSFVRTARRASSAASTLESPTLDAAAPA